MTTDIDSASRTLSEAFLQRVLDDTELVAIAFWDIVRELRPPVVKTGACGPTAEAAKFRGEQEVRARRRGGATAGTRRVARSPPRNPRERRG